MDGLTCDMCGKPLLVDSDVRYVVNIEVFAAYDPMELTSEDIEKDHRDEIRELARRLGQMEQKELEDQVYRRFEFDLCPACQKKYLKDPLSKNVKEQDQQGGAETSWE